MDGVRLKHVSGWAWGGWGAARSFADVHVFLVVIVPVDLGLLRWGTCAVALYGVRRHAGIIRVLLLLPLLLAVVALLLFIIIPCNLWRKTS